MTNYASQFVVDPIIMSKQHIDYQLSRYNINESGRVHYRIIKMPVLHVTLPYLKL
jgi:hypothetical protein